MELSAFHACAHPLLTNTPGGSFWCLQLADEKTGSEWASHPFKRMLAAKLSPSPPHTDSQEPHMAETKPT